MEIESQHARLFYSKSGQGPKTLILFHGFGQDHTVFQNLASQLTEFTCYSFDLFFHGQSQWTGADRSITKDEWKNLMNTFLQKEGIVQFSVLGYSLGGRPALACAEAFSEKIDTLILVAAEGLQKNFWYDWATNPWLGKALFRKVTHHPTLFVTLATGLKKLGIIPRLTFIFATKQMNTTAKRMKVYHSWIVFTKLRISLNQLVKLARQHDFKTRLIFGTSDGITKLQNVKGLRSIPNSSIEVLDTSHGGLLRDLATFVRDRGL